jgi:hypothetical protein
MEWLVILIVIVLLALFLILKSAAGKSAKPSLPYQRRDPLFTAAERSFFGVLEQATQGKYQIFGKVRVADVLKVKPGLTNSDRQSAFNRISGKHFDYLLCEPDTLSAVCAIELNDKSHKAKKRSDRDDFLAGACEAATLPLLFFKAKHAYTIADLRASIDDQLNGNSGSTSGAAEQAS